MFNLDLTKVDFHVSLSKSFKYLFLFFVLENVAFNKTAQQKNLHNYGADLAIDGRKSDLSAWGGECAVLWH